MSEFSFSGRTYPATGGATGGEHTNFILANVIDTAILKEQPRHRKKKLEARARTEDGLDKGPPHAMALDFRPWRRFRSAAETKAPEEKDDATTISFDAEAMAQLDPFSRANFVGVDDDIEGKDPAGDGGGGSGDEDGGSADGGGGPAVAAAWRDAVADIYKEEPRMPELQCHVCGDGGEVGGMPSFLCDEPPGCPSSTMHSV